MAKDGWTDRVIMGFQGVDHPPGGASEPARAVSKKDVSPSRAPSVTSHPCHGEKESPYLLPCPCCSKEAIEVSSMDTEWAECSDCGLTIEGDQATWELKPIPKDGNVPQV